MINNKNHLLIFAGLLLMDLMCVFLLLVNLGESEDFTSELDWITNSVQTPKRIGQGQHGSARWLKKKEYDKAFQSFALNSQNDKTLKALIESGKIDRTAVERNKKAIMNNLSKAGGKKNDEAASEEKSE